MYSGYRQQCQRLGAGRRLAGLLASRARGRGRHSRLGPGPRRGVARILEEPPDLTPDHQVLHQTVGGLGVAGSPQAVEPVVTNLVGIAAKYSPARTVIRVYVTETRGRAELAVDDEGPGVPPAEREQVFTRCFRGQGDPSPRPGGLGWVSQSSACSRPPWVVRSR